MTQRHEAQGKAYTRDPKRVLGLVCGGDLLGAPIVQIRVTPVSLETIFMELTGKELRD